MIDFRNPKWLLLFGLAWSATATAESLESYAQKCDAAIRATVPQFNCDNGTLVPTTHLANGSCDRPNRLNRECDPGSRFTVLSNTPDAYVVAHCRKTGLGDGRYGDIAVIQHSRTTGATCFYQALTDLPAQVAAPKNGRGEKGRDNNGNPIPFWFTPKETADTDCVACHDNGPLIRSPYLAQLDSGPNALPGAGDSSFNGKQKPYGLVGDDFANRKVYRVEVEGNFCISCHRLGVNTGADHRPPGTSGTAVDFALRATGRSESSKNPHSNDSPIWMPPSGVLFDQRNADAAREIHDCAVRIAESSLPNSATCRITEYTASTAAPAANRKIDLTPILALVLDDERRIDLNAIYYLIL